MRSQSNSCGIARSSTSARRLGRQARTSSASSAIVLPRPALRHSRRGQRPPEDPRTETRTGYLHVDARVLTARVLAHRPLHSRPRSAHSTTARFKARNTPAHGRPPKATTASVLIAHIGNLDAQRKAHAIQVLGERLSSALIDEQPCPLTVIDQPDRLFDVPLLIEQQSLN